MACDFYWISGSPFSWRVHLALEFKGIRYNSVRLNANDGEHEEPDFLALNPRGKVPVLKDGGDVVYESVAIFAYLEAKYPAPPLLGVSPSETGQVWQRIHEVENYARNPLLRIAIAILGNDLADNPDEIAELIEQCSAQLEWIECVLSGPGWFAGTAVSGADFIAYPILKIFLRAAAKQNAEKLELGILPFDKSHSATASWMAAIEALPGYANTFPPHWRG